MELLSAIYQRRATRHFSNTAVKGNVVLELLGAAAQAPSALNLQSWAFAVFHGRNRLLEYSERAKAHLLATTHPSFGLDPRIDHYVDTNVNIFHGADTLIVICAKPGRFTPTEDCFLAAQNLMLAAHGLGLSSCPVGFARPWFNRPDIKAELGISTQYTPVSPIVVGHPADQAPSVPKNDAEIVCWHWDS
jgi:nitroreductase